MMKEFDFHSCENCIFHKHEYRYDEDYCGSQHATLVGDTKDKNECLCFMPKIQMRKGKPEDNARKVEFCLVNLYDKFEFERRVEEKLNDGWKPVGGVCYECGCYLMGFKRLK